MDRWGLAGWLDGQFVDGWDGWLVGGWMATCRWQCRWRHQGYWDAAAMAPATAAAEATWLLAQT